jgi:hypothetical protein
LTSFGCFFRLAKVPITSRRRHGVDSLLQVFERHSRAHDLRDDTAPETKATFAEITASSTGTWRDRLR